MAALETTTSFYLLLIDAPKMQLLLAGLCLAGALLLGAIVLALFGRWWKKRAPQEDLSPSGQLAHFRSLYEKGAISREEFERLRTLLGVRLRETMGMPRPAEGQPSLGEGDSTRRASRPPSDGLIEPPGENGQSPENPDTGIRPAQ